MSLICLSIMVTDEHGAWRDAQKAGDLGADLVEYRLDEFFSGSGEEAEFGRVVRLVSESPLPCIVTCRPPSEGGHYDGDDDARISLFERLGTAFGKGEKPPRYLDIELSTLSRSANIRQKVRLAVDHPEQVRDLSTSLIVSTHDFAGRPSDLTRRLIAMQAEPAAKVLKVAYRARSIRDNLELFELLSHRDRPMVALGMGEFGLISRILAPKFGGFLTFASLRPETVTAPGQPTIRELLSLYRFRSISPSTAVYGVVGYPVSQSLSPLVHNTGFESIGHDGVYVPLPIPEGYESLKATLLEFINYPPLTLRGLSVTHPHKENLVRLARESGWTIDSVAEVIGAANSVSIDPGGAVRVFNTDVAAVRAATALVIPNPADRRITILGSGGAARAAAYAFATGGARVTIASRTRGNAEKLASDLRDHTRQTPPQVADWSAASSVPCDAIINCTPVGMLDGPAADESPVDLQAVATHDPHAVAVDTIYNPIDTPFLRQARAAGLSVVDGVSMFVHQAAAQFEAWTGRAAPLSLFERIVRESAGIERPAG